MSFAARAAGGACRRDKRLRGDFCMGVRNVAKFGSALLAGVFACAAAYADTVKPAVIYDLGGKFDKSFNEGVFNGATKFAKDTGVAFRDLEIQNDAQREQVLRKFAKEGFSPI